MNPKNFLTVVIIIVIGIVAAAGIYFPVTRGNCAAGSDGRSGKTQTDNNRNVFKDPRYPFEFAYPAKWSIEDGPRAEADIAGILILKDEYNYAVITIYAGLPLVMMGVSYCGAHPEDKRCEALKSDDSGPPAVTIDWGIDGKASAIFSSPDGTYGVSFTLHKINSVTKTTFRKILLTFKFLK